MEQRNIHIGLIYHLGVPGENEYHMFDALGLLCSIGGQMTNEAGDEIGRKCVVNMLHEDGRMEEGVYSEVCLIRLATIEEIRRFMKVAIKKAKKREANKIKRFIGMKEEKKNK